jgi:hypothetical protein
MGRQPINAGGLSKSVGALWTPRVEIRTSAPTTSGTAVTSMGGNRGLGLPRDRRHGERHRRVQGVSGVNPALRPCSKWASIAAPSPATLPHAYSRSFSAPVADQPGLARPEHQRENARPAAPMCESRTRLRRPNGVRGLGFSPWPRTAQGGCRGPTLFPPILLPGDQGSATCFSPLRRVVSTVQGSPRRSQMQTQAAAGHHGRRRMSTPLTSGSGISARDAASW